MYCSNCGKENDDNVAFCSSCGKSQNDVAIIDENKKMIATGNRKGHSACAFWAIMEIIIGIAIIVFFNWMANEYSTGGGKNELYNYFMGIGWICGIRCFIYAILFPVAISKTRITIYKDKVEGVGASKYFIWGDPRTFNFMYPINQVSIDVNGGKLIVHGQNTSYSVYVDNGSEIQNALWEAKKAGANP